MNKELKRELDRVLNIYPKDIDSYPLDQYSNISFDNHKKIDFQNTVDYFDSLMNKYSENEVLCSNLKIIRDSFNENFLVPQQIEERQLLKLNEEQEYYLEKNIVPLLSDESTYNFKRISIEKLQTKDLNPELTDEEILTVFTKIQQELKHTQLKTILKESTSIIRKVKSLKKQIETIEKKYPYELEVYLVYNNYKLDKERIFLNEDNMIDISDIANFCTPYNIANNILKKEFNLNNDFVNKKGFKSLKDFVSNIYDYGFWKEFLTMLINKDISNLKNLEDIVLNKIEVYKEKERIRLEEEKIALEKRKQYEKEQLENKEILIEFRKKMGKYSYHKSKSKLENTSFNNLFSSLFLKLKKEPLKDKLFSLKNHIKEINLNIIKDTNEKEYYIKLSDRINYYFEIIELFESLKEESILSMIKIKNKIYKEKDYRCLNIKLENNKQLSQLIYEFLLYQPFEKTIFFLTNKPIYDIEDLSKETLHDFPITEFNKEEVLETVGEAYSVKTRKQGRKDKLSIELFEFNKFKQKSNNQLSDFELRYKNELYLKHAIITIKKLKKIKVLKNENLELSEIELKLSNIKSKYTFETDSRKELREAGTILGEINYKLNSFREKYYNKSV